MKWVLDFVRPPETASWKEVNRWRWNVALTLLVLSGFAIFAMTPRGVVLAGDLQTRVAKAVDEKLAPVVAEQKSQRAVLDKMSTLLIEQLAASKAAEIRLNISKRCKASNFAERDTLLNELDRLRGQYFVLKGETYREPTCGEL